MPDEVATPEEIVSSADYEHLAKILLESVAERSEFMREVEHCLAAAQVHATLAVAAAIRENAQGCCLNRPYQSSFLTPEVIAKSDPKTLEMLGIQTQRQD